jgi:hypothetical protein
MFKAVLIPSLAIVAAIAFTNPGCGGTSSTGSTGSAGHGGTTGSAGAGTAGAGTAGAGTAGAGTAGAGTAGAGTAGAGTAGAGTGGAGTAGAGTAGAGGAGTAGAGSDGGTAGTSGGNDGGGADVALPACTVATDNGPALSASDFCTDYLANCKGVTGVTIPEAYNTFEKCLTAYMAATTTQKNCRSHHLCNAFMKDMDTKVMHCPHAVGMAGYCQ